MLSLAGGMIAIIAASAHAAPQYSPVPRVGMMRSDCVRSIPTGTHVEELASTIRLTYPNGTQFEYPHCEPTLDGAAMLGGLPADYDGWEQYTAYKTEDPKSFDVFTGYFSVPDVPAAVPQVLYLFTGLQNIDWIPKVDPEPSADFDIIQPVLQYPAGDGQSGWAVRSWYVTLKAGALASDPIAAQPGDVIFGNMTRTGPESWAVVSTSSQTGATTTQSATNKRLVQQPWAYTTLECYGCNGCSTYPEKACEFTKMALSGGGKVVTPTWQVNP